VVLEVNSTPGLEGIETATSKDIAGLMIEYLEKNAALAKTRAHRQA
jgi:ribosomal protein S6--L-glutamate ligase